MPSLAEIQGDFRRSIGSDNPVRPLVELIAPGDPLERLSIYRRHFRESFRRHLRGRFPTVEWLIGTPRMVELADLVVRERPPKAPSLAEYGAELAVTLAVNPAAGLPRYLADVAWLDWHLGNVAIATATDPLAIAELALIRPEALPDVSLTLQPGVVYLRSPWPIDSLITHRLNKSAPDRLRFDPETVQLELRGARGDFHWTRLGPGEFAFRSALRSGHTLGAAAGAGLAAEPSFGLPGALARTFADGLVTRIHPPSAETTHA